MSKIIFLSSRRKRVRKAGQKEYGAAMKRLIDNAPDEDDDCSLVEYYQKHPDTFQKFVFLAVKLAPLTGDLRRKTGAITEAGNKDWAEALSGTATALSVLTPAEVEQLFPTEKSYHENPQDTTGYFYTKRYLAQLDDNKPIAEQMNIADFLDNYNNPDISQFTKYSRKAPRFSHGDIRLFNLHNLLN